jgi:hypothetical protein
VVAETQPPRQEEVVVLVEGQIDQVQQDLVLVILQLFPQAKEIMAALERGQVRTTEVLAEEEAQAKLDLMLLESLLAREEMEQHLPLLELL